MLEEESSQAPPLRGTSMRRASRIALLALTSINALMLLSDLFSLGMGAAFAAPVVGLGAVRLGTLATAFVLVPWLRRPAALAALILFALAGNTCVAMAMSIFRGQPETVVVTAVTTALGGAVIVPWGARWQLVLAFLLLVILVAGLSVGAVPASVTLLSLGVGSILITPYLAWEMSRTRRELAWSEGKSREARKQARARAQELQAQVASRTAELAATEADLEQLCRAASHDLRPPLRTVTSYSQLMLEIGDVDGEDLLARQLKDVAGISSAMADRLDDLLVEVRVTHRTIADNLVSLTDVARAALRSQPADLGPLRWFVEEEVYAGKPALALADVLRTAIEWGCRSGEPVRAKELRFRSRVREEGPVFRVEVFGGDFEAHELDALVQSLAGSGTFQETSSWSGPLLAAARTLVVQHGGAVGLERPSEDKLVFWFSPPATNDFLTASDTAANDTGASDSAVGDTVASDTATNDSGAGA